MWSTTNVEDGQQVNFNQLDLPINLGESVEIRMKAVSEAGYPANPSESEWSDVILIPFPDGMLDTSDIINLVDENSKETTYVKLVEELDSKGVYTHIADSFIANEKYYSHGATNIASGFLSSEQTPISLFDKLIDLQREIESLREQLAKEEGELLVSIVDDEGRTTQVEQNTSTKIFAGYYVDEVADLNIKKGAIVTKTYKLLLENSKASDLELVARIIGDRSNLVYPSSTNVDDNEVKFEMGTHPWHQGNPDIAAQSFVVGDDDAMTVGPFFESLNYMPKLDPKIANDTYYTTEGKYDLVPIQYQNLSSTEKRDPYNGGGSLQAAQRKGQWIYSRFMNISGEESLYAVEPLENFLGESFDLTSSNERFEYYGKKPTGTLGNTNNDFIWNGDLDASGVIQLSTLTEDYDDCIFVHIDHPLIGTAFEANWAHMDKYATVPGDSLGGNLQTAFRYGHSKYSTLNALDVNGNPDPTAPHLEDDDEGLLLFNRPGNYNRTGKMSFSNHDEYLLGGKSCGAYLFLSPTRVNSISVDGDNKFGKKTIGKVNTKQQNSINAKFPNLTVDIIFQYRMTDYFGVTQAGGVDTSTGRLGGLNTNQISNLTYSKKIGIDLFEGSDNQFSFDLEVFSKYRSKGYNLNNTKKVRLHKLVQ